MRSTLILLGQQIHTVSSTDCDNIIPRDLPGSSMGGYSSTPKIIKTTPDMSADTAHDMSADTALRTEVCCVSPYILYSILCSIYYNKYYILYYTGP